MTTEMECIATDFKTETLKIFKLQCAVEPFHFPMLPRKKRLQWPLMKFFKCFPRIKHCLFVFQVLISIGHYYTKKKSSLFVINRIPFLK